MSTNPQDMPCCPPGSLPYLAPDYNTRGTIFEYSDSGLAFYGIGSSTENAIIILPEPFGWNSGRTRVIADILSEYGYLVVVPKLLGPTLDKGIDGDGFAADATFDEVMSALPKFDFEFLAPALKALLEHLTSLGYSKIGALTFCWGGWVACRTLSTTWGATMLQGCVCAHPSISLETRLFRRDTQALFDTVQRPLCLLVAKNDPDEYRLGGAWFESLKARFSESESYNVDANHGWMPKGDINDPAIKAAVEEGIARSVAFFAKIL